MKKRKLYREIQELRRDVKILRDMFCETRQTVDALTDKLDAEAANAVLEADMPPKSETQIRIEKHQGRKKEEMRLKRTFLDDPVGEKNQLTAEDVIKAAQALAKIKDEDTMEMLAITFSTPYTEENLYAIMSEPTDEELEKIDALLDELEESRDSTQPARP